MGYVNTFADEMTSVRSVRRAGGFLANPVAVASMLALSACATFFAVKGIMNSTFYGGLPSDPAPVVSFTQTEELAVPMTTVTTTTTTTATTTAATAATTVATAPPEEPADPGRFKKANLLYPASFPDVDIPSLTLPAEFGNGLLDPEAVFWLVNELRVQNGLPPFERAGAELGEAAQLRAGELLVLFSQTRPDGTGYASAYDQCGVRYEYTMESAGYGQYTAEHIVSEWMESEQNMKNLLNTTCTSVYIVCVVGEDNIPVWVLEGISQD